MVKTTQKWESLNKEQKEELIELLKDSTLFKYCADEILEKAVHYAKVATFEPGDILQKQGEATTRMFVVRPDFLSRFHEEQGQSHRLETTGTMFGSLHVWKKEPGYATLLVEANSSVFCFTHEDLKIMIEKKIQMYQ